MGGRRKHFNWALYENLRQVEREEAFRLLKWAVDSLPPPWDSGWNGVRRKPYDARALTAATIWREIEDKPERAYTADLERDKEYLRMLGLEHAPHRTALYRTRKRPSEGCMEKLNRKRSLLGGRVRTLRDAPVQARLRLACNKPKWQKGTRQDLRPIQP